MVAVREWVTGVTVPVWAWSGFCLSLGMAAGVIRVVKLSAFVSIRFGFRFHGNLRIATLLIADRSS